MFIHHLFHVTLSLLFSYVDSQRGEIKKNNKVYDNLCVMIKTHMKREIDLFEQADVDLLVC